MKKSQKVLVLVVWVSVWIFSAISFYQIFEESLRESRYEYNDLWRQVPPTQNPQNAKLNNDLVDLVWRYRQGQISVMDLSTITPFVWDRVHLFSDFPGFMNYKDIDDILGKSWRDIESCDYAVTTSVVYINSDSGNYRQSRGYSLFIFTHKNTVVYCMFYIYTPAAHVYINSVDIKKGIPRENALFIIDKEGIIRPLNEK